MGTYSSLIVCCVLLSFISSISGAAVEEKTVNGSQAIQPQEVDICDIFDPCLNGGTCFYEDASGRSCRCSPGYHGSRCHLVDFCHSNPCNSNGTCFSERETYTCTCFPGYIGKDCSIPDPCLNTTCYNGGTCVLHGTKSFCDCPGPFTGKRCDLQCSSREHCYGNGKECVRYNSGSVSCRCSRNVPGNTISCVMEDDLLNECLTLSNPCNGGSCTDHYKGFYCSRCPTGRSGSRCEVFNPCLTSPCQNGGTCSSTGEIYECLCSSRYQGKHCQWRKDSQVCSVTCNPTYFEVTCNANLLPSKVRQQNLFTRVPDQNSNCTCSFPNERRIPRENAYYNRQRYGYSSYQIIRTPCKILFDSCGSKVQVEDENLVYDNFLRFNNQPRTAEELEDWKSDLPITRDRGHFQINLHCQVQTHVNASQGTRSDDFDVYDDFTLDLRNRIKTNILSISFYTLNETTLDPAVAFSVDNSLFAMVSVDESYNANSDLQNKQLRLRDCFATPTADSNDQQRYYLLKNGCPKDQTFRFVNDVVSSGQLQLNSNLDFPKFMTMFSFRPFTFKRLGTQLFVHCDGDLCSDGDCNHCVNAGASRQKRHLTQEIPLDLAEPSGLEYRE